jgi:hypothetical protein
VPPLQQTRLVIGLVLGLKAQILFMAPFTAAFSRLIGGRRVTNTLTTSLCLAPLMGAALGTAIAPALMPLAGHPLFVLTVLPSLAGLLGLLLGWRLVGEAQALGKLKRKASSSAAIDAAIDGDGGMIGGEATPTREERQSWWAALKRSLLRPADLDSPHLGPDAAHVFDERGADELSSRLSSSYLSNLSGTAESERSEESSASPVSKPALARASKSAPANAPAGTAWA